MSDTERTTFESLGLSGKTLEAIRKKGFEEPSEIQTKCIPLLLEKGTEVVGQAQTGTGKTAAFALPIIETLDAGNRAVQALVLTPTRELALQVSEEISSLKGESALEIAPIYGGASMSNQLRKLKSGVQIVVGTPGRILDHMKRGSLVLDSLEFLVLDEADEMLDMGFIEDIEEVLKGVPEEKRMLMFSATIPPQIQKLASTFMKNPVMVRTQAMDAATEQADQIYYEVRENDKLEALSRIIDRDPDFYGVIFCRTKLQCDEIGHKLQGRGYDAEALHGDLSQRERETILRKMKERVISILVATDVAARGLDIQDLTHVINYSLPSDPEIYIHRVGRTGRAGKEGTAITFITPSEARRFSYIKKASKAEIRKEEIPTGKEVVETRRERIVETLSALPKDGAEGYLEIADELLSSSEPRAVVASILSHFYRDALDESQYRDISVRRERKERKKSNSETGAERKNRREDMERPYDKVRTPSMDDDGLTRLFIARGRNDGLTKASLRDAIIAETNVRAKDLRDIEVMEDFSFINAPYDAAEHILKVFKPRKGDKPVITKARKDEKREQKEQKKKVSSSAMIREMNGIEYSEEEEEFLSYQRPPYRASVKKGAKGVRKERCGKERKPKSQSKRGRK